MSIPGIRKTSQKFKGWFLVSCNQYIVEKNNLYEASSTLRNFVCTRLGLSLMSYSYIRRRTTGIMSFIIIELDSLAEDSSNLSSQYAK